jgi:hypothetical protein
MNDKDKEAFVKYMRENLPFSYYVSYHCPELKTWQAACEHMRNKSNPLDALSLYEKLERERAENKILYEALNKILNDYRTVCYDGDWEEIRDIAREALKEIE